MGIYRNANVLIDGAVEMVAELTPLVGRASGLIERATGTLDRCDVVLHKASGLIDQSSAVLAQTGGGRCVDVPRLCAWHRARPA